MQWTIPSISWKLAWSRAGGSSKPKRLITPSTSIASSGRLIGLGRAYQR